MFKYSREEKYTKPKNMHDMLKLALKREKASAGFYNEMLKHVLSDSVRNFIIKLRDEEIGHARSIEKKISEIEG